MMHFSLLSTHLRPCRHLVLALAAGVARSLGAHGGRAVERGEEARVERGRRAPGKEPRVHTEALGERVDDRGVRCLERRGGHAGPRSPAARQRRAMAQAGLRALRRARPAVRN
jgi:hypothetical protein